MTFPKTSSITLAIVLALLPSFGQDRFHPPPTPERTLAQAVLERSNEFQSQQKQGCPQAANIGRPSKKESFLFVVRDYCAYTASDLLGHYTVDLQKKVIRNFDTDRFVEKFNIPALENSIPGSAQVG